jgi:hypothetical protein
MENVPLVELGGIVIVAGTPATLELLDVKLTTAPDGGAGPVSDTIPVAAAIPPCTMLGFKLSVDMPTGTTVSNADWVPL